MFKHLLSIIAVLLYSGLTITSGIVGLNKLSNKTSLVPNVAFTDPEPTITPSKNVNPQPIKTIKTPNFSAPTVSPTPTLTNTKLIGSSNNTATTNNSCVVTLFGKQYDVSSLRSTHPGGNIFNCGTDMTAVYQSQHGTDLTRMQPYLISATASASSSATTVTPSSPNPSSISTQNPQSGINKRDNGDDQKQKENHQNENENESD